MPEAIRSMVDASAQQALQRMLKEMPDVKPVTASPSTGSILARIFQPKGAIATTNPFTGNITYNPDQMIGMTQDEIDNTIAHELTHSRQAQNTPWYKMPALIAQRLFSDEKVPEGISKNSPINTPYYWRPDEMEAFQTERNRMAANPNMQVYTDPMLGTRDIQLFPERKKTIDTAPRVKR